MSLPLRCAGHLQKPFAARLQQLFTKTYSTASSERIGEILNKQKTIPDNLSPTNSKLLTISLSDFLPPECLPTLPPATSSSGNNATAPPLPQGHHLIYFPIQARPSELHPDGTDADHWPGEPFMRRMWAGGEVRFRPGWDKEMRLDAQGVECLESVEDVRASGITASGAIEPKAKAFVDVWRRYKAIGSEAAEPAIEERRTLVFMPEAKMVTGQAANPKESRILKPPHEPEYSFSMTPTRALLANFSALTYNAHSIHLDTAMTQAEGHRDLLFHGPLSLALMFAALKGKLDPQGQEVRWLGYRNIAPLYCGEKLRVCLREKKDSNSSGRNERNWDVWIEGKEGGMAVKGTATTARIGT